MKVSIELRNVQKINYHIEMLNKIYRTKNLNAIEEIIMLDTISVFEEIKKELGKRYV